MPEPTVLDRPTRSTDRVSTAFLDHHAAEIDAAADGLRTPLEKAEVLDAVRRCIVARLTLLVPRVFVVEFHEFREALGLPVDATSDRASRQYLDAFDAATVARWNEKYPVFADLVAAVVRHSVVHVREIAGRLGADLDLLRENGFVQAGTAPVWIEHLGSDAHQQGRMVAAVHFADGSRVIYKPRSLGAETLTRRCLSIISPATGIDLTECAPDSLDRGTHGWQRDVVQRPATDSDQVQAYYRSFGAVCALMGVLGATDMHHENIVAVADHPVLVDLETVLHTEKGLETRDVAGALVSRVKLSLAGTVLLPQRLPSGPYSVLMGGLGVPYEQESERSDYVMVDRDTDAVDIARRTFRYRHTANVLRTADGTATDVLDHTDALVDGFRRGYRAVIAERDALRAALEERSVPIRQIFRSTAIYARILNAATHPDNLRDPASHRRIVSMLRTPPGHDQPYVREFIADAERAALAIGDVPYFVVDSDDVRVRSGGFTSTPYCELGPVERAKRGLQLASREAGIFEELILEEGLSELRAVRFRNDPTYHPAPTGPFRDCLVADPVADQVVDGAASHARIDTAGVVDVLRAAAVRVDTVDGPAVGWVGGAHSPAMATYDPGTCVSLHDAGGAVVLFDRLATGGGAAEEQYAAEVRRGLRALRRRYRETLEGVPLSVASGPISVDLALTPGAERYPDAERRVAEALAAGSAVAGLPADTLAADDLMRGLPGIGLLLAGAPGTPAELVEEILRRTPTTTSGAGKGPFDLAHGELGLTWARGRMLRRLGRLEELDELVTRLGGDVGALLAAGTELPRGWCSGWAGLLMVTAELSCTSEGAGSAMRSALPDLAERATSFGPTAAQRAPVLDLSVCHGSAGVVQSLVAAAGWTGDNRFVDRAARYWEQVAARAVQVGFCTGEPEKQGLLGYFLGWTGIADTGVLLADAQAGRPAWVPTAFTGSCGGPR